VLVLPYAGAVLANVVRPHGRLPDLSDTPSPSRADGELSHVVAVLAGRGAEVRCWSHADWKRRGAELQRRWPKLGRVGSSWRAYTWAYPVLTVHFSPEICIELTRLRQNSAPVWDDPSPDGLAWTVAALGHESVHVSGELDEAKAECYGMQRMRTAAVELGRSAAEGQYLAERYWKRWYRWSEPPYESHECRNGGELDLRPGTDIWP
jgi:hypothetical protein